MNVLIAFDKFKDSMSAQQACEIVGEVLSEKGEHSVQMAPMADGGEGFAQILTESVEGTLVEIEVLGPQFETKLAHFGMVEAKSLGSSVRDTLGVSDYGKVAVIEMAQASGLESVPIDKRDPWIASTFGTGQMIAKAADLGAQSILLGVGGSATNDLGLGALEAIGLEFAGESMAPMSQVIPRDWNTITRLSGEIWPHIPPITIACDVGNPLLGPNGCTSVYGPQKGLKREDFNSFEKELGSIAKKLCHQFDKPRLLMAEKGAGAAGGISFGLMVACDAKLTPGFDLVCEWLALEKKVAWADVVVTGEGRFDQSSLQGKGPGTLVEAARLRQKGAFVLAGSVDSGLSIPGVDIRAISPSDIPLSKALEHGPAFLRNAAEAMEL